MGARTPADPQTSTFAGQKRSGVVVKCSKGPFLPNRRIESPAERAAIDSPSLSLGGRRVPNVDSIVPPGPDELQFVQLLLRFGRAVEALIWGPATILQLFCGGSS